MLSPDEFNAVIKPIRDCFDGGDRETGEPAYCKDDVVAYSPKQAQAIFQNLMEMRVKREGQKEGEKVPFLITNNGWCTARNYLMLWHMLYHQAIDSGALGVAVCKLRPAETSLSYYRQINNMLNGANTQTDAEKIDLTRFTFHVAPTVQVYENGRVAQYVFDPALHDAPVTIEEWAEKQGTPQKPVPVCHAMLDHPIAQEIQTGINYGNGGFNIEKNDGVDYWHRRAYDSAVVTAPWGLASGAPDDRQRCIKKQTQLVGVMSSHMLPGRVAQEILQIKARDKGLPDLPNCGPQAFEAVNAHISRQPSKPGGSLAPDDTSAAGRVIAESLKSHNNTHNRVM